MSLLRREARQWAPEPIISPFPGMVANGTASPEQAMQNDAVWACVDLLASTLAMMELDAFTVRQGTRVPLAVQPQLLTQPSSDMTLPEWLWAGMASVLLRGNAYGNIVRRDWRNFPTQIEWWDASTVAAYRSRQTGMPVYRVNGQEQNAADVFHVRGWRLAGQLCGLSPVQYAAAKVGRAANIEAFAGSVFTDAVHPSGVLSSDQPIDDEEARRTLERLKQKSGKREPLILGAGLTWGPGVMTPEDAQFLQTANATVVDIARYFRVHPSMIAAAVSSPGTMQYQNVEVKGLDFLTYSVQHWLTIWQAALSSLFPGSAHVEFNPSVLLRMDAETLMKVNAIGIASKQLTPTEARETVNRPPLTDEQKAELDLVPLTISPTGMPKALPQAATEQEASDEPDSTKGM